MLSIVPHRHQLLYTIIYQYLQNMHVDMPPQVQTVCICGCTSICLHIFMQVLACTYVQSLMFIGGWTQHLWHEGGEIHPNVMATGSHVPCALAPRVMTDILILAQSCYRKIYNSFGFCNWYDLRCASTLRF